MKTQANTRFLSLQESRLNGSRIVSPDKQVSEDSVFGDPVWKMNSLVNLPGIKSSMMLWDFSSVPGFPNGFSLSLAEYAYARLYAPDSFHEREVNWLTVYNELTALKKFAIFCQSQGIQSFHLVDEKIYEAYLRLLQFGNINEKRKTDERVRYIFRIIYQFWNYRTAITTPIAIMPFGKPFNKLLKKSKKSSFENATPVIPEPIYAALMSNALDYVLVFSLTIIAVWQELKMLWVNEIFQPGQSMSNAHRKLRKAASELLARHPITWRKDGWSSYSEIYDELQQLRVACILVILAYSGIRVSELLSLEAGCYVSDKCEDGNIRYYINTALHKHRSNGTRDTWVVINEVVKAIQVLEVLTDSIRKATKDARLMLTDSTNNFFSLHKVYEGLKVSELQSGSLIYQINSFRKHCNTKIKSSPIPNWTDDNGVTKPWQFNTRQFRRTLARYIARQPFGIIAGMIQYKHVEVAIFQGYAGVEPEWNTLLEQEKVLASVDILEEVALDLSNGQLAGNLGIKLKEEFRAEFRGRAEDYPPSQIAKWLSSSKKPLFVGKFNFCFFEPTRALCVQNITQANGPKLNFCHPDKCANACIGNRHIGRWEAQLKQAEEIASYPKASPAQRELLQHEVAGLRAIISHFEKKPNER